MSLQELIDKRYSMVQQKEQIERDIADLDHEILTGMLQSGIKQEYGSQGIGYSITSTTRYDFGKAAYRYLADKGLLEHFTPEPKITKTKLDALIKEGVLTYGDMAEIEKYTTIEQSPYALRKIIDKEAAKALTA